MSMNIYTLPGKYVKVTEKTLHNGIDSQRGIVKKYLELDKEYEIIKTEVHSFSTYVFIKDYGKLLKFNSVFFENVEKQSKSEDKKHSQWKQFNT